MYQCSINVRPVRVTVKLQGQAAEQIAQSLSLRAVLT